MVKGKFEFDKWHEGKRLDSHFRIATPVSGSESPIGARKAYPGNVVLSLKPCESVRFIFFRGTVIPDFNIAAEFPQTFEHMKHLL